MQGVTRWDEFACQWLRLDVNPEPWAIGPVGSGRKDGRMYAYVGQNKQLAAYKEAIAEVAREQWEGDLYKGHVRLEFYFWRQLAGYVGGRGKVVKHTADTTNMQKATEDALQDIAYENDRQVRETYSLVVDQGPDVEGLVVARVALVNETLHASRVSINIPEEMLQVVELAAVAEELYEDNVWPPRA